MSGKTRAANDLTIGEAEQLNAIGLKIKMEAQGNEWSVWALLLSYPRRHQDGLIALWGVSSLEALAKAIAGQVPHG